MDEILKDFKYLKDKAESFVSVETWQLGLTMKNIQNRWNQIVMLWDILKCDPEE